MEKLFDAPPLAIIAFGAVLAVIFAVRYLGLWQGQNSSPSASAGNAQVAAVIVDPSALNRATAAIEALNMTIIETNIIGRDLAETNKSTVRIVGDLRAGISDLRDEVIRTSAKIK